MKTEHLTTPWWALRGGLGAAAFLAGLDKFFNLLADWPQYLSPLLADRLPASASAFMHLIGGVEMAVGAVIRAGSQPSRSPASPKRALAPRLFPQCNPAAC